MTIDAAPAPPSSESQPRARGWKIVRLAALVLGLVFLAWIIVDTLRNPAISLRDLSIGGFALAVVVGLAANATVSLLFSDLVGKLAPGVPVRRRLASYYLSQFAKYVPGRVAALLVQSATLDTRRSMTISLVTSVELMAIAAWTCSIAAIACALIGRKQVAPAAAVFGVGALVAAWLIRIDWRRPIAALARVFRLKLDDSVLSVAAIPSLGHSLLLGIGSIVLPAASMYALVAFGFSFAAPQALSLTSALLASWVAGVVAVIFPAGIGIRELVFLGLGHAVVTGPASEQMGAIAVLSRLVQIAVDVCGGLGFMAIARLRNAPSARSSAT